MSTIMFDAFNTPAHDPIAVDDIEAADVIQKMMTDVPVYVRAFPGRDGSDNVTVFWTLTPRGEVGTIFEHTRHNAFNVPMGDGDRAIEGVRWGAEVEAEFASTDYDGYAVGE